MHQLREFKEGVFGTVFDTLDRIQHIYWKDRPDVIRSWYTRLDAFTGRILAQLERSDLKDARLLIVSDHGFAEFNRKAHLNRWLMDRSYLAAKDGGSGLRDVDWSRSQAYALGLNSLYFNLAGREGQGIVRPEEAEQLAARLCEELLAWRDGDGKAVVQSVLTRVEAFDGPLSRYGPDLVVGYAPGFRASQETGLGGWGPASLEDNTSRWNSDHCIAPEAVPGVLFSNRSLGDLPAPSYRDFPALALGKAMRSKASAPPPVSDDEDEKSVEERLKGLGYL
jgi:predicted AlkP superfamily phosphohydrolase/phosphomutase